MARTRRQQGFVLIAAGACVIAMVGLLGLAADVGRMYIVRNEAQAYADAAAIAAALELDGTSDGISRAREAVAASPNLSNLGTQPFSGTNTDFATAAEGPWLADPSPAAGYRYVRVTARSDVKLYFIPIVGQLPPSLPVSALSIAGQVPKTTFREGLMPFSPLAHDSAGPNFGLTVGEQYTMRWPASPRLDRNLCAGDNAEAWLTLSEAGGAQERGYIENTSSEIIRQTIEQDYQSVALSIGESVTMTGGNKQTQKDSLITRVLQDTDPTSATYAEYVAGGLGNGRRLVVMAINTGYPEYRVLGFGAFFLLPESEYTPNGNDPFCAEYVGPYVMQSDQKGAGEEGAYEVRLVS